MKKNKHLKNLFIWIGIVSAASLVYHIAYKRNNKENIAVAMSDFEHYVRSGQIKQVNIHDRLLHALHTNGKTIMVNHGGKESFGRIESLLSTNSVHYAFSEKNTSSAALLSIFLNAVFPLLFFFGSWFFIFRQMQNRSGRGIGMQIKKGKKKDTNQKKIQFKDVKGVDDAKDGLAEIVEFLKKPSKFKEIGARIPRGVLLVGPPGTGKTLLARAVAGEAKVPFFSISGSDFVEMFVGVGASRVRELFGRAKEESPCIIFIDEIDAVGRKRSSAGVGGGHDEREQTLNQLLVEMDGFDSSNDVIILASTNRADILDKALLRPGRFDRQVAVDLPDLNGRIAILNLYLKKIKHVKSIDALRVASGMPGFSGADIENMVNESALLAARKGKTKVDQKDLEESRDKIIMGPERKTLAMTEEEKKITAYHEAGHAVVAFHCAHSDPIYKATIIPRGNALGMVIRLPENDRVSISKTRLLDDLAVALGGRVAEEIIFGADNVTTGASSDFQFATSIAKRMVTEWGMSTVTGMVSYPQNNDPFSSNDVYSEKTLLDIDQETKKIIDASLARTRELLNKHRDHLTTVANALIEKETLSGQDIQELLAPESKTDKTD